MSLTSSKSCNKTKVCDIAVPFGFGQDDEADYVDVVVHDGVNDPFLMGNELFGGGRDRKKYCSVYCLRVCNNILQKYTNAIIANMAQQNFA